MIHFDHTLPGVPCFNKTLPAGTWEQSHECAIVELDHAQLRGEFFMRATPSSRGQKKS
jgi:hypothetical protein